MLEAVAGGLALGTEWLLTYLLHSSMLIAAAWLAVRTGRVRAPESQDLLWKFTALAGIVTATAAVLPRSARQEIQVTANFERVAQLTRPELTRSEMARSEMATHETEWTDVVRLPVTRMRVLPLREGANTEMFAMNSDRAGPSPECRTAFRSGPVGGTGWVDRIRTACSDNASFSPSIAWYHVLVLLWGAGAGLGLLVHWRRRRSLADLHRSLVPASLRADQALADVVRGTSVRSALRVSSALDAPCVIGRHTIALPDRSDRDLPHDELRAVLAHEVAHVCRSDTIWLAGLRLVVASLWLQPLNRLALKGFEDAAELVCDDWAVTRTRERLGLARSILRVAEWALSPRTPVEGVVGMVGGDGHTLSGRIRRILTARGVCKPASRSRRVFAGSALLLPLMWLPSVPSPVVRHTAILVEQVAVIRGGADSGEGRRVRVLLDGAFHVGNEADEETVFARRFDWESANSGS